MAKLFRSAALAAGLAGLLGNGPAYAHTKTVGDLRYSSSAPIENTSARNVDKDKWRQTMDYEGGVFPLENFGEKDRDYYKRYFDLAVRHLRESGLEITNPELVFFDNLGKLSKSADESRVMVVGQLRDSQFSNGDLRYSFNTEGDGKMEYKLSPLFIDASRVPSGEDKAFDLYSSFIKSLAGANIAERGFPLLVTDKSPYFTDESFEKAYSDSVTLWNYTTKEVVLCLLQGISMRNGANNGISKRSIQKNLKDYPSLLRRECVNPLMRRAILKDYRLNPFGIVQKLQYLEKKRDKGNKPN